MTYFCDETISDDRTEGWIWLPHEELMKYQRQYNKALSELLDNAAFVPTAFVPTKGADAD